MRLLPLITITLIYFIVLTTFNYCFISLITNKSFGHQYYLILIYFISESLSVICYLIPKKKEEIAIDDQLGPLSDQNLNSTTTDIRQNSFQNMNTTTNNFTINNSNNNSTMNYSESIVSVRPFVGMKCISFIIPSLMDFLSKLFLFNGIKYLGKDNIFRCVLELIIVIIGGKLMYKFSTKFYTLLGPLIILFTLIISFLYFQITERLSDLFTNQDEIIGVILCVLGEIFECSQFLIQALFFKTGEPYFYRTVTFEAAYGIIFSCILLLITMIKTCPFNNLNNSSNLCNGDSLENNFDEFFSDIKKNHIIFTFYYLSSIFVSFIGVFITKYVSLIYRVAIDSCKIFFFIFIRMIIGRNELSFIDIILGIVLFIGLCCGLIFSVILENQKIKAINSVNLEKSTVI